MVIETLQKVDICATLESSIQSFIYLIEEIWCLNQQSNFSRFFFFFFYFSFRILKQNELDLVTRFYR